jgi:butyrate kinase
MSKPSQTPLILTINPGSTSTKLAAFRGRRPLFECTLAHTRTAVRRAGPPRQQAAWREVLVRRELSARGFSPADFDVLVGRVGLLRPLPGGVYAVNERMLDDLRACAYGEHASNLGAVLAHALAGGRRAGVYIADPVVVDELDAPARITGLPGLARRSVFHALNQKAAARRAAQRLGKAYEACNLVVAHVGGGISVGVHRRGRVVDVNNALDGEGPFTPERTGGLPLMPFLDYVHTHGLSRDEARTLVTRQGGLLAHLGTNDCREIAARVQAGSARDRLVFTAFVRQLAKAIAGSAAVVAGRVDAVVLTGQVLKCAWLRRRLVRQVRFLGPVQVLAGSLEMEALAHAGLEAWLGRRRVRRY